MGSLGTPKSIRRANPAQIQDSVFKMFDMHGKVTIITGGSGGIGYEVARALAEAGSDIALWYHKSPQALKLAASIEAQYKVKCKAYQCAVENFDEVENGQISPDVSELIGSRSKQP
jgi:sorbose reductase